MQWNGILGLVTYLYNAEEKERIHMAQNRNNRKAEEQNEPHEKIPGYSFWLCQSLGEEKSERTSDLFKLNSSFLHPAVRET